MDADGALVTGSTVREVAARHAAPRCVIASGRVVAESTSDCVLSM